MSIYHDILQIAAFSEHEHHMPDAFFCDMTLDKIVENSYAAWCGRLPGTTPEGRAEFISHVAHNSYWTALQQGVAELHGTSEDITAHNWDQLSQVIRAHHADGDFHWQALRRAGYEGLIQDTPWQVGGWCAHTPLFYAAYRIDSYLFGINAHAIEPDTGDTPVWQKQGFLGGGLEDYVGHMRQNIRAAFAHAPFCALKCAIAYHRTLDFTRDDPAAVKAAFGKSGGALTPEDRLLFGNYIFHRCCELACELGVPLQLHSGLGKLPDTNPMLAVPTIARHEKTRFVLLHAGFPWLHEAAGISHNHVNTCASLTWVPLISPHAARQALNLFLDCAPSVRTITWGSDCWTPEESIGALRAWQQTVAHVLDEKLATRTLTAPQALKLAERLMRGNVREVYGIG